MISGWTELPFGDVVADETGGNIKTLQKEFLPEGAFPIVDQGKELVAGFTDDSARLCKSEVPAIIFGDHTKCLKFIDFPFCLGADGTKILRPKIKVDMRYLFYYLQTVHIPDAGYSRHFKYLKKSNILLPPLEEQKRIAAILDQADALRRLRQEALDKLNTLAQSIFYEMFGDPVTNSKGWPISKFGNVGQLDRGKSKHRPRNDPALLGGKHPFIQTGDVANCDTYIHQYTSTYSDLGLAQSKLWQPGVLCITIAANIAKTGILTFSACFPDSVVGFQAGNSVRTEYVQTWLSFLQKMIEQKAPESAQKNINLAILRSLPIPIPDMELQDEFVSVTRLIEEQKTVLKQTNKQSEKLFVSLQQRAFRGEL